MSYAVQDALADISHVLGGELSERLSAISIVNEAGRFVANAHRWNWLVRPPTYLTIRGVVTITAGSWTVSTRTLTSTGSFASYTFLDGDVFRVTGGGTSGYYPIESRTSDDAIVLKTSMYSSNLSGTVTGTLTPGACVLPSDFNEIVHITPLNGLLTNFSMTDMAGLSLLRTKTLVGTSFQYWGAVVWGAAGSSSGGSGAPRLEIYPPPPSNLSDNLFLVYRAVWPTVAADDVFISIPEYMENLYRRVLREFALSYEEYDKRTMSSRLQEIMQGPEFAVARKGDGNLQTNFGPIVNGAVQEQAYMAEYWPYNFVSGP